MTMRYSIAKRILSLLTAFILLLSLVPSAALAAAAGSDAASVPEGHVHNESGWVCRSEKVFVCPETDPDHTHDDSCYEERWTCKEASEFVLLSVEYFVTEDGQEVRVAETHEALLKNGAVYYVTLPDLSAKGYALDLDNVFAWTTAEDGSQVQQQITLTPDANGRYIVGGTITQDIRFVVNYIYTFEKAPYRLNYYGYDAQGKNEVLLYSFIGEGIKDQECVPPVGVNGMVKTLYDDLGNADIIAQGPSGEGMIQALTQLTASHYGDERHDITPLLEMIAQTNGTDVNSLTRTQIKQYLADRTSKMYGLDLNRNTEDQLGFTVTADGRAERNIYFMAGQQQNVLFTTGVADTFVSGIPQQKFAPAPDADGVTMNYDISYDINRITALPTVDISAYTQGVDGKGIVAVADPDKGETHRFIGWVTGPGAGVIADYTPDAASAGGRYDDLTIYTTPAKIEQLTKDGYAPANGSLQNLAEHLKTMPEGGATYYAVWEPYISDYVVQVWFEDPDTENLYNISHTLDIVRRAPIGQTVRHNAFDVERADESRVVDAANNHPENFPVVFTDPDSRYGVSDSYDSYRNSYVYSPFYGFDFLVCEECAANPDGCTCAAGTCSCATCQRMTLGADPVTGAQTTGNRCNCAGVTLGSNGKTVLNVFYTREQWKIVYHPTVELTAYKDYASEGGTPLDGGMVTNNIETIIGRFTDDLTADMFTETITPVFPYEYTKPRILTFTGKYGMPVSQGRQVNEDGTLSAAPLGPGYTGTDFSQWKQIVLDYYAGYPYAGYELFVPKVGEYTNNYFQLFLGDTAKRASDLYFTTEPHNYDYYLDRNLAFESAQLPFAGVAEITPAVYMTYQNKGNDCEDMIQGIPDTVTMQRYTGTWKGDRFSRESTYFLDRVDNRHTGSHYDYGTHTMHLYPFYGNVSNAYTIQYYGEALPSEPDANCRVDTSTGKRYTLIQTDTVEAPCDVLQYEARIPAGFMAQMWRTSINQDFTRNDSQFTASKVRNVVSQSAITGSRKPMTIPPRADMANPSTGNYANYQRTQVFDGNSYNAYLPTWEVWQRSLKVGNMVPDSYWITDWIRLTDDTGANMTTNVTAAMKERLQSSVCIGALYPSVSYNRWRYMNTSPTARNGHLYPRSSKDSDAAMTTPMAATNVLALTRNQYTITYNTAFVDAEGKLLTDENGHVRIKPVHTTEPVFYQQLLDGTGGANNYYNAYFCYDPAAADPFTLLGYEDAPLPGGASPDASKIGGAGKWYLDADGTVEFSAKAMSVMPAKNIDVYYLLSDVRYNVVFIDRLTGTQTKTFTMNGEQKTFANVLTNQVVRANDTASPVPSPSCDGYSFAGWFLDEAGTVPFSFTQEITKDTVVYAVWNPKTPTTCTILHVLELPDGTRIELTGTQKDIPGYTGDTVDANALGSEIYQNGTYFEPDYYSQSMVLDKSPDKNVLTFVYHSVERSYKIRYREKDNEKKVISPDVVVDKTTLNYVTVKYKDFEDWGWKLIGEPYETRILEDGKTIEITFWYERIPGPTLKVNARKYLDAEPSKGTRFTFALSGSNGYEEKVQAADGLISFEELYFGAPGIYTFTLTEENEGGMMKYDDAVYQISVTITQDDKSVLHMDDEPVITLNGAPYTDEDIEFHNQTILMPATGDKTPLALLTAVLAASLAFIVLLLLRRKHHGDGQ